MLEIAHGIHVVLSILLGLMILANIYTFIRGSLKLKKIERQADSITVGGKFWGLKFIILILCNIIILLCVFIPSGVIDIIMLILLVFNCKNTVICVWNDTLYTVAKTIKFKDIETIYKSKKRIRIVFNYGKGIRLKIKTVNDVVEAYENYVLNTKKN